MALLALVAMGVPAVPVVGPVALRVGLAFVTVHVKDAVAVGPTEEVTVTVTVLVPTVVGLPGDDTVELVDGQASG